jgi:hypothetical protein
MQDFIPSRQIRRPAPNAIVFDLSDPSENKMTLPAGSIWTSSLHWHETHVEYLRVIRGSIKVQLDDKTMVLHAPEEPGQESTVRINRWVRHDWGRADGGADPHGEDVVVIERTEPDDGLKKVFFWSLNAIVLEMVDKTRTVGVLEKSTEQARTFLKLMVLCEMMDNWAVFVHLPGFVGGSKWIMERAFEWVVIRLIFSAARIIAWLLGVDVIREDDMPRDVYEVWMEKKGSRRHHKQL